MIRYLVNLELYPRRLPCAHRRINPAKQRQDLRPFLGIETSLQRCAAGPNKPLDQNDLVRSAALARLKMKRRLKGAVPLNNLGLENYTAALRRRRMAPIPASPAPNSESVRGSGVLIKFVEIVNRPCTPQDVALPQLTVIV